MGSGGGRDEELGVGVAARPLAVLLGSLRDALAAVEPGQVLARDAVDLVAVSDRIERLAAAGKALAAARVAESSLWSRGGHRSPANWKAARGPIPVADVWRMIDGGAFVAAISTRGTEISKVVHLGRRPTVLQQTALEYLSGGVCSIEGCTSRARLETDHVTDWAATHRTELAELAPACGHHHDLKTHHGHRFGPLQPNGTRQLIAPDRATDATPPDATGPPDLTLVEEPIPPPTSRPLEPEAPPGEGQPPPPSVEERARTIGRNTRDTLFDTG